jgi:hypothetical protein
MSKENYISNKEHKFLLSTVLFALLLRIISSALSIYITEPNPNQSFGLYSIFDMTEIMSPIYSFIVFFICIFLVWKINLPTIFFSCLLTLLLTIFFDWWFIDTQQLIAYAAKVNPNYEFKTFDFILIGGSIYDVLTLFAVNFLFFWQASIFVRMLRKDVEIKSELS